MRKGFLCLLEEYSYFLKSCFSAMDVEIFQGYAGVEICPKYVSIFCYLHSFRNYFAQSMTWYRPSGILNGIVPLATYTP